MLLLAVIFTRALRLLGEGSAGAAVCSGSIGDPTGRTRALPCLSAFWLRRRLESERFWTETGSDDVFASTLVLIVSITNNRNVSRGLKHIGNVRSGRRNKDF